ncbi:hypothetical protein KUTeg_009099 [Tegillarca granosa]|uniref:TIR domain-containing protein n=1 Tax=Tegillarca granosa TaxID=220873 RepID=A0ABQ9F7F1_TEGGR|nr:hypothetical protein KUTeg_009099 [Tegillarca granosa]
MVSESVDMGKENLFKPMIKNIQMRFRDLLNEIDSKHFQETLVQCDILSTEFFHSLKNLPRRKRAEMLIINLFMCPEDWVPVFMKILQEKYKISYQSIMGIGARIGIANDDSWCNQCTRKIIKYIVKDSMDNAKIPLDAGKLVQVLFEEQVIMPRQYEEVIVQDCLSKRTETLLNIIDNEYTDSRCLGAFKKAINEAGYENCCNVLEDVMSNWRDCKQCNGHFTDDVKKEKQMFGKLREQRLSGYDVSSTLTHSENSEKNEKTIVYKFEVNSRSEEEHDKILKEFIARKNSLDNCIKGLGEVVSIAKGCIAIVVKCNQTDSSYGDVAIKMLESMLSGNLPWNVLDNGNIKVQICVTELSEGEDTELMHDKISLLHHVPVILEEMDALDFEHAFAESGLIDTEDFWRMFDIENIGRQERMLKLLRFILKNDQRIFFDCFINVLRDSFDTPLEHLKNLFSQIEGKTFDRNTKQNTYSDINCIKGVQTEHNERVDDNCYKRFAASFRQYITIKNRLVYLAVFLLILLLAFCMTIPFKAFSSSGSESILLAVIIPIAVEAALILIGVIFILRRLILATKAITYGKTFDRNIKQNTDISCTEDKITQGVETEHNERVNDNCYKRFAASSRQYITIKKRLVYLAVFLLILLFAICMTILFKIPTIKTIASVENNVSLTESFIKKVNKEKPLDVHLACFPSYRWNWTLCLTNNTETDSFLIQNSCSYWHNEYVSLFVFLPSILTIIAFTSVLSSFILRQKSTRNYGQPAPSSDEKYVYDAFISYSDRDLEWVKENAQRIEREYNLRFCFPERDFVPGKSCVRNIVESIQSSKCIVAVVSEQFLDDPWSHLIIDVAQCDVIERSSKQKLIAIYRFKDDYKYMHKLFYSWWKVTGYDSTRENKSSVWENVAKLCFVNEIT